MPATAKKRLTTSAMIASFADPGSAHHLRAVRPRARRSWPSSAPRSSGLSADLAKYTDMHIFRDQAIPDRFFQMGMAEQSLMGAAAGMAEVGLVPFASTYSVFAHPPGLRLPLPRHRRAGTSTSTSSARCPA